MKNIEFDLEKEIDFMIEYQLTADELFTIKLVFYAQEGHPEYLSKFFSQGQLTYKLRDIISSLQDKQVILKSYKIPEQGSIFKPEEVEFNKIFIKKLYQHSMDLGMELFELYPPYTTIDGRVFSLRNITKLYNSLDELCWRYGKVIKWDLNKHQEVLDLLQYGVENDLIRSGICDFIESRQWQTIQAMKDNDIGSYNGFELV